MDERAALARRRGATQQGIDARHEHARAIGLGNEVVRAERHGHDLVDLGRARREDDDGNLGFAADFVADMLAVFDGKRQVEQYQVGCSSQDVTRDMLERLAGLDLKTGTSKDVGKLATNGLVVLNDIDQRHGFRSPLGCLATIMAAKLQVCATHVAKVTELFASGGVWLAPRSQRVRGSHDYEIPVPEKSFSGGRGAFRSRRRRRRPWRRPPRRHRYRRRGPRRVRRSPGTARP